ncbi:hypothetical protein PPACK8108_LOCUS10004 [Phakopsora pachyrhizi]|uniref:Uncharacterized protein n=1 Tax=Phakopsora pachyrhizi TaxID=170000 RepID=A0AAV0AZL9_PHAPC|nr:hypothetical protein PPACK8108_LOCUS10004 [Phakopsora pachyrhizi]
MRSRSLLQMNLRMAPTVIKQRANSFSELEQGPIDDKFMLGVVLLAGSGLEEVRELAKRLAAKELKRIDVVVVVMAKIGFLELIEPNNRLIELCDPPVQRFQRTTRFLDLHGTAPSRIKIDQEIKIQGAAVLLRDKKIQLEAGSMTSPTRNLFEVLGENDCNLELFQANMEMKEKMARSGGVDGRMSPKINNRLHLLLERSDQEEEEDDDDEIESLKYDKARGSNQLVGMMTHLKKCDISNEDVEMYSKEDRVDGSIGQCDRWCRWASFGGDQRYLRLSTA